MVSVAGKKQSSGVIILEPDGRVWVVEPTNHFGGYEHTFPKGKIDGDWLTSQENAVKEAWEESGLHVKITGYFGDYEKSTSVTRYYRDAPGSQYSRGRLFFTGEPKTGRNGPSRRSPPLPRTGRPSSWRTVRTGARDRLGSLPGGPRPRQV